MTVAMSSLEQRDEVVIFPSYSEKFDYIHLLPVTTDQQCSCLRQAIVYFFMLVNIYEINIHIYNSFDDSKWHWTEILIFKIIVLYSRKCVEEI